jgi:putative intracellular protease/amidase
MKRPSPPALLLRKILQRLGLHPDDHDRLKVDLTGQRALIIATNHAALDASSRISDVLANHGVVDGNLVTGQNQNAGPMVAREMLRLAQERLAGGETSGEQ